MKYRFLRFPGGVGKAVTLSYDDGCPEDIRFSDRISKAGLKCTFNLNSNLLRQTSLTDAQIVKHFLARGHEIAVHGAGHRAVGAVRNIEGVTDVLKCRLELEERFGIIIRGMAYPDSGITCFSGCTTYDDVKRYLTNLDIVYSRTLGGDNNSFLIPQDWHAWMPSAHHSNPQLFTLIDEFLKIDLSINAHCAYRMPRLFYLWGHSFEFERKNNWELLDSICEVLADQKDVWYATNIEIYEYVNAFNSLIYSADGTIVYNPTLYDIWFDLDGTLYKILSGQTLKVGK